MDGLLDAEEVVPTLDRQRRVGRSRVHEPASPQAAAKQTVEDVLAARQFGTARQRQQVMVGVRLGQPHRPAAPGPRPPGRPGDACATSFETQGWKVQREFYYNDAGVQIQTLAHSVQAPGSTV